jgi:hypothetical protein
MGGTTVATARKVRPDTNEYSADVPLPSGGSRLVLSLHGGWNAGKVDACELGWLIVFVEQEQEPGRNWTNISIFVVCAIVLAVSMAALFRWHRKHHVRLRGVVARLLSEMLTHSISLVAGFANIAINIATCYRVSLVDNSTDIDRSIWGYPPALKICYIVFTCTAVISGIGAMLCTLQILSSANFHAQKFRQISMAEDAERFFQQQMEWVRPVLQHSSMCWTRMRPTLFGFAGP